ncbi:MAG: HDOD domain-containing protein [Comamonadaceae bacterium]|nr:MAG: HDOD domain-containing protein [Comamonadaceae bacterium]
MVSLSESDAVTALQVALRSRQAGPGRSMAGKSEDSPVRPDALIDGVASRALADHALDQQGAWAVAGWPLEDVLHRSDGEPTAPTRRGLVRAMSAIDAEQSLDGIDHVIGQEPALAYRLLVYLNSPGLGLRNGVSSLRHGFMMLGFQKLNAWLSQQLPTASEDPDLRPVNAAMVLRGQLMAHLMDAGLEDDLRRELTLCGLFSQLDLVMNEPLRSSFARIPVSGRIVDATIGNAGPYAPALRMAEALGLERPDALRALRLEYGVDAEEINRALLRTLAAIAS